MENLPAGWIERRSGLVVPGEPLDDGRRTPGPRLSASPPASDGTSRGGEDAPAQCRPISIVTPGQILGFGALVLLLTAVVAVAALGQAWVGVVLAGTALPVVVATFVTGQYQPAPAQTTGDARRELLPRPQHPRPEATPPATHTVVGQVAAVRRPAEER